MNRPVIAGNRTEELRTSLRDGGHALKYVPSIVVRIVDEEMWRERVVPSTGEVVRFESFREMLEAPLTRGLETPLDLLRDLCRSSPAALDAIDRATARPNGGDRRSEEVTSLYNVQSDKPSEPAPTGNSRAAGLRRLRKDAPELHARVVSGELSVNAAAIEAGHRPAPSAVAALRRAWARASEAERAEFLAEMELVSSKRGCVP